MSGRDTIVPGAELLDVERLCQLMVTYGLTRLVHGRTTIERPYVVEPTKPANEAAEEPDDDPLHKIRQMTPEQQDRALQLLPTVR